MAETAQQPAEQAVRHPARQPGGNAQPQGDQRILHALNRFTFGPRPGDVAAVRAIGLDAWFNQQLHPQNLDETALHTRLAQFPALQEPFQDVLFQYPSNVIIRQIVDGRLREPQQPAIKPIYDFQIYRERLRRQSQGQGKQAKAERRPAQMGPGMMALNGGPVQDATPAMAQPAPMDAMMQPVSQNEVPADPALIQSILALPPDQRIERLESLGALQFESVMKALRPAQRAELNAGLSPQQREILGALVSPQRQVAEEVMSERLIRDIYSNAQVQEVMTDFWLNHFNIYLRKNEMMPYYLVSYARDTIRPHALGHFEDLLEAVAHSPAMMVYLDNADSIGPHSLAAERAGRAGWRRPGKQKKAPEGINENYGRELMELHTLGVNGGYTQQDVIQASRVLTGWGVAPPQMGGFFVFNPNRHEPGSKTVLGVKIKNGGENEGRELLHLLATRPATAQFLSKELAERFVSDHPPQSLVDRMAHTYMTSNGDIADVLTTLFHSPEFWAATDGNAKVKTPLEFVVSAARASNADVVNPMPLANALRQMGMPIYGCIPPTGYHWDAATWVSTSALVDRMNFALNLAADRLPGVKVDWAAQLGTANSAETPQPQFEEARLEKLLLPGGVSIATRSAALAEFKKQIASNPVGIETVSESRRWNKRQQPDAAERQDQLLAGLLLGSPEFQRR